MKQLKLFFLTLCLLALVACAGRSRQAKVESSVASFQESAWQDVSKFKVKKEGTDVSKFKVADSKMVAGMSVEQAFKGTKINAAMTSPQRKIASIGGDYPITTRFTKEIGTYDGQDGDTLMLIAFKLYGDYRLWHRIKAANPDLDPDGDLNGQKIRYPVPAEKFVWEKKGDPYLIRSGDTLGKISNHLYQTPRHWQALWDNNRPMIQDPDLIFTGFTLYYLPSSSL